MSIQKISYIIILSLGLLPIASCQKKEVMPEFHVQISHPDNKYQVTPIKDYKGRLSRRLYEGNDPACLFYL